MVGSLDLFRGILTANDIRFIEDTVTDKERQNVPYAVKAITIENSSIRIGFPGFLTRWYFDQQGRLLNVSNWTQRADISDELVYGGTQIHRTSKAGSTPARPANVSVAGSK